MWSPAVVYLTVISVVISSEDTLKNVQKIISWYQSGDTSPQFTLGVSIGVKLLRGSDHNTESKAQILDLIEQLNNIQNDFLKSCDKNDGDKLYPSHLITILLY